MSQSWRLLQIDIGKKYQIFYNDGNLNLDPVTIGISSIVIPFPPLLYLQIYVTQPSTFSTVHTGTSLNNGEKIFLQ